jgi:ribosomal protein L40E
MGYLMFGAGTVQCMGKREGKCGCWAEAKCTRVQAGAHRKYACLLDACAPCAVIGGSMVLVGFAYCCFCSAKGGPTAPKTPGPVSFSGPPAVTQFPSTGYPMAPQWDAPPQVAYAEAPAYDPNPAGRVCSQCYTSLPVGAQFCPQCGARP